MIKITTEVQSDDISRTVFISVDCGKSTKTELAQRLANNCVARETLASALRWNAGSSGELETIQRMREGSARAIAKVLRWKDVRVVA